MPCIESGRELLYRDESSQSLCQKLYSKLPNAGQTGAFLNAITLAGVMYALKLLREDETATDEAVTILTNSTA